MDENNLLNTTPAAPADEPTPAADTAALGGDSAAQAQATADEALQQACATVNQTQAAQNAAESVEATFAGYTAPSANACAPQAASSDTASPFSAPADAGTSGEGNPAPAAGTPNYAPVGHAYSAPQPVPGHGTPANPYGTPNAANGVYTAPQPVPGYGTPANPYGTPDMPNGYAASQPVPGYGAPGQPGMPQPAAGMATASLVLGIVALVFCLFGEGAIVSVICGIVGIVLASNAKKAGNNSSTRSAGFILSLIGLIGGALVFVACAACMSILSAANYL